MKLSVKLSLLAAALLVLAPAALSAQQQSNSSSGVLVAVIDVPKVFDNHPVFKQQMEAMASEVKAYEVEVQGKRQSLTKRAEQLKDLTPSSVEYKRLEEELAKAQADLAFEFQRMRKEMVEKEAKQYFATYNQVLTIVQTVADRHRIGLVLSYDSKPIDQNDLQSVARGVNRSIVYQRNLDITQLVIDELAKLAQRNGGTSPR